ncbi:helix-turn-helix domain-containing protein, partial [Streptomyces sp. NPDC059468]|uniref:helix-turn-helix domain-containing protein n=1 Tax=Streptomyces sp. NPDC059468 TaxID=3346845 RepID=UPI0036C9A108
MVFEAVGVSPEEETVYGLLVTSGRATTADLVQRAGLTEPETERILTSLTSKGLATHTDATPRMFRAVPPDVGERPQPAAHAAAHQRAPGRGAPRGRSDPKT